jgi:hypothetical protein
MLFTLKDIHDFRLSTVDGDFGEIKAFLIDDYDWVVRYLVAEVGSRQVLLSVASLGIPMINERVLPVSVSKEMIMNSPTFDLDKPVSREIERKYSDYFDWPYYWEPDEVPNTLPGDLTSVPLIDMQLERERKLEEQEAELIPGTGTTSSEDFNQHLRSTRDLFGGTIHTTNDDRSAGKLADMVTQAEDWSVLYLVVDTGGLLTGKKVLFAPTWVQKINESGSQLDVNLKQESINEIPEFRSIQDLTPEYHDQLKNFYNH